MRPGIEAHAHQKVAGVLSIGRRKVVNRSTCICVDSDIKRPPVFAGRDREEVKNLPKDVLDIRLPSRDRQDNDGAIERHLPYAQARISIQSFVNLD